MKLTKKIVEQAQPSTKDVFLWDSTLPGFGLSVKSSGVKSYVVQYRDEERRSHRLTIGRHGVLTPEQARQLAVQALAAVARGENPAKRMAKPVEQPTVDDLAARYLSDYAEIRKKPRSLADDRQKLKDHILPDLKERTVASVSREDVAALHHKLRKTPYQANRVLALLSKMFNLAELWGWRPDGTNPCRRVEKYKEKPRQRYLSDIELRRLGEAMRALEKEDEPWPGLLAIRLLMLSGCRLGEVLALRWEHVDFEHGRLNLPDSKTGQKLVTLGAPAVKLLQEAPRKKGSPWVCPSDVPGRGRLYDLNGPWRRVKKRVEAIQDKEVKEDKLKQEDRIKLEDVRLHDLRHSFASVGAGAGLGLPVIGALLGHTQAATTARYAHLANDPLKQAAGIVAGHIAAVLESREPGKVVELHPEQKEAEQ